MSLPAPSKDLGQHFLVDDNIVRVIGRLAELQADDVVLEVGPGQGVLTAYLSEHAALVHAVELDPRLEPHLTERFGTTPNVRLHFADALRLDPAALDPPPTKLVANLPYNVATPIVVESLAGSPTLHSWCVMVQREVAERFFAQPGTKAYGAVSVLVQLAAERTGFHPVSREVFRPRPNVDSVSRRLSPPHGGAAGSMARAQAGRRRRLRAQAEAASELARARGRGRPRHGGGSPRRAGSCPDDPRRGARPSGIRGPRPGASVTPALALAKINLALVVGPKRPDGKHEVSTVLQRISLADTLELELADELAIEGFAEDTLVRRALEELAKRRNAHPGWHVRLEKQIPVAAGLGGGSSDAAVALRLANSHLEAPLSDGELHALAAELGADVPFFLTSGPQLGEGDGTELTPLDVPQDYWVLLVLPHGEQKSSTAAVYEEFDRRGGDVGFEARRAALREALTHRELSSLPPNDLASSPLSDELLELGALRADVSGAGPAVYGLFAEESEAVHAHAVLASRGEIWLAAPAW